MACQIGLPARAANTRPERQLGRSASVVWLQGITLAWMLAECGVALCSALVARSPAMLAFGSDSLVELLSASVVLWQFIPGSWISEKQAARFAGVLLIVLAFVITVTAILALTSHLRPEVSVAGIGITVAALVVMPVLARLKRAEARKRNNAALAADAMQSAACAYLAAITLAGLAVNAVFHIPWSDAAAAILGHTAATDRGKKSLARRSL